MELTNNQLLHRQYLQSETWKNKRKEALQHHGTICNRCKEYGTDVHHKTYERVGGFELMSDLEVLCRDCHTVHHSLDKYRTLDKQNGINQQAIYRRLSEKQKYHLIVQFNLVNINDLYTKLTFDTNYKLLYTAIRILGFDYFYKQRYQIPKCRKNRCKAVNTNSQKEYFQYQQFKVK